MSNNTRSAVPAPPPKAAPLLEIAAVFLRLGFTAFGGPAAHIALMREEFVARRNWLTEADFLDLLGAANLVPGPNSTEMAIHLGHRRGGWAGLLIAGACFILPAAFLVAGVAWAYARFGRLPAVAGVLFAVKPVVVAVLLQAVWGLAKPALKTRWLMALGAGALFASFAGVGALPVLFGAGTLSAVAHWWTDERCKPGAVRSLAILAAAAAALLLLPSALTAFLPVAPDGARFGLLPLFLFFVKVGSVLYGSGYVLLSFLRDQLVTRWHWITETQLLDATAIGQVTPGPVFTTATFIGYLVGGAWGAVVATIGIFAPSFVFVAASGPLVPRLRRSALAGAFLDGVNAAALALLVAVGWQLARAALVDSLTIAIALVSAVLLLRFKVNSAWLLLGAAVVGFATAATLHR